MIQEYIAFGIFLGALIIASLSIVRFILEQIRSKGTEKCKAHCNCKPEEHKILKFKPIRVRKSSFRSVKMNQD
jgi:hypothetical protein